MNSLVGEYGVFEARFDTPSHEWVILPAVHRLAKVASILVRAVVPEAERERLGLSGRGDLEVVATEISQVSYLEIHIDPDETVRLEAYAKVYGTLRLGGIVL